MDIGDTQPRGANDPLARTELTFLLGMAFQLVLGEFVRRVSAAGYADLRPLHGMVFQALRGPGATSTELAERLGVTKQAAGQLVDDLERRGYVRREPHPAGGRRRLVVLTDNAHRHLAVAGRILHELEAELAQRLDAQHGQHGPGEEPAADLAGTRVELARLIRALAGDAVPPLRPIW
ncbi:MarR family winged helix-turn-helix transcriptional regulator [Rugosimonospora acidiphila]|uniref:MarR family winged helix-turn-helix transcriptional regulator n=1 Tax=Rugosimonospora acidiphila TaxID=556531 RepID=A0ABP9SRY6_9ACTN